MSSFDIQSYRLKMLSARKETLTIQVYNEFKLYAEKIIICNSFCLINTSFKIQLVLCYLANNLNFESAVILIIVFLIPMYTDHHWHWHHPLAVQRQSGAVDSIPFLICSCCPCSRAGPVQRLLSNVKNYQQQPV